MVKHSSRIELSQSALQGNFDFLRQQIGEEVRVSSVVKANAYGHGIFEYVPMAENCGVDHFSVASSFEAAEVLQVCSSNTCIMIMGILYDEDVHWVVDHGVEFYVFNYQRMPLVLQVAKKLGKPAIIHLEVETGTNRTGMEQEEFSRCLDLMQENQEHFRFEGLCTHFGGAESFANDFKIQQQYRLFNEYHKTCRERNYLPAYRHLASSAAALSFPASRYEMVRVGVSQYGFWPGPDVYYHHLSKSGQQSEDRLHRIFTWKTEVMDVRPVEAGAYIGYGTAYLATHDMTIAVLPLGYSNGYPRGQSNRGQVLIKGKRAPITGLINMNLFMVDISHIPEVEVGEEVVLIGRQGENVIDVASFTESEHLLNQEMMSRLPAAIPRTVVA